MYVLRVAREHVLVGLLIHTVQGRPFGIVYRGYRVAFDTLYRGYGRLTVYVVSSAGCCRGSMYLQPVTLERSLVGLRIHIFEF